MSDASDPAPPPAKPRGFRLFRTVGALMLREMSTTYGRNSIGYLTAIIEPLGGIILLTFVFTLAFRTPPLGDNFPLFYATGLIPLGLFTMIASRMGMAIKFSRNLLSYPGVTIFDAILARCLLAFLTQAMVAYLIFGAILVLYDLDPRIAYEWIILALLLVTLVGFGVGTVNAYFFVRFPIYETIWSVVTRPLFLISGVIILYAEVPMPYREYLWWNPLIHATGMMRRAFYPVYDAPYISVTYMAAFGLLTAAVGLVLLLRNYRALLETF